MKITLSNLSGIPIYEQIKDQIKSQILSGELKEGDKLPSLRELARDLRISVLTTTRVYTELEKEGFITNIQGRGCYVLGEGSELLKEHMLREMERNLSDALKAAKIAGLDISEVHQALDLMNEEKQNE
ncbi:MAG TPA: GntR family transcriptional regulator [Flexilinea sp.]|jgi:GntR family transcriptional regulator|nr:GntR family transcriptional regulator [Flexilinea sp.]OQA27396.1 MAG: HTH-type transcriptional repressor YtrA [Chloroflexi bacterium ADurb.Bin344]HNY94667.1 GntR family transcriptional regulator [Flexilinea sp.]HOG22983.1 GntR family transcriptional regulator [Flexilinea sp.]HOG59973.1 GntR family transcriptional regulator [Flexilinea sp.]